MKTLGQSLFLIISVMLLSSCGKDRDLQDYKNDLLAKSLAKIQGYQGSYSGYVLSKKDQSNMGVMKVTLIAKTKVVGSSDQSGSTAQPVLAVSVEFQGVTKMAIVAQDSYVDAEKGQFQTDIPVRIRNSQGEIENKTVTINGVVFGDKLTGDLHVFDYPDYGAKIELSKQNESLDELARKTQPTGDGFSNGGYRGTTKFNSGVIKNVLMVLLKPNTTSEADFYNLFSPVKPVQVTLNYGQNAQLNFTNGNWDQRVGKLTGQTKLSQVLMGPNGSTTTQTIDVSLICDVAAGNGFSCKVISSNAVGTIATIKLTPNTTGDGEVEDDDSERRPVTKSYTGLLKLSPTEFVPATMAATYPARTRMEEITNLYFPRTELNVVVNLNFGTLGVTFANVKWDTVKGTLDANQSIQSDGLNAMLTLTCQNFYFTDKEYSYYCRYHSSIGNTDAQFIFESK